MNNPFEKIVKYWAGQKLWLALVLLFAGIFLYGQLTATKLFNSTPADSWKPSGSGSHNSGIHHK